MSAYSTIRITRTKAKELIAQDIAEKLSLLDEELEKRTDEVLDEQLYNCEIVPDGEENDDHYIL